MNQYEFISIAKVYQCIDCGAFADKKEMVQHYSTCNPGEAQRWLDLSLEDEI
jgi:hypothetical protein